MLQRQLSVLRQSEQSFWAQGCLFHVRLGIGFFKPLETLRRVCCKNRLEETYLVFCLVGLEAQVQKEQKFREDESKRWPRAQLCEICREPLDTSWNVENGLELKFPLLPEVRHCH